MTIKHLEEKRQPTPHWRFIERTVAVLEKFIAPGAKVQLDIKLPVLGSKRRRQCDVVVWAGTRPRETLTIVNAQDRRRQKGQTKRTAARGINSLVVSTLSISRVVGQMPAFGQLTILREGEITASAADSATHTKDRSVVKAFVRLTPAN